MYPNLYLYIYLIIFLLMVVFDAGKASKKSYNQTYKILFLFLAFLVAFRYYSGMDTPQYMNMYELIPTIDQLTALDFVIYRSQPLFILLNSVCKSICDDFVLVQIIQASLFYHSLYRLLTKLELKKFYILYIFFGYMYLAEMSALRESLGLAFCFYAIPYFMERKWIPYYILSFIGFMFHSSMIIFFVFPFVRIVERLSLRNALVIIILSVIVPMAFSALIKTGVSIADNSITRYGNEDGESGIKLSGILYNLSYLFIVIYFVIIRNKEHSFNESWKKDFIYLGGIVYPMISLVGALYFPIMYRLTAHFSIFYYFTITIVLMGIKRNQLVKAIFLIIVFYSPTIRFISSRTQGNEAYLTSYCSVFSSNEDKAQMKRMMESVSGDYIRKD